MEDTPLYSSRIISTFIQYLKDHHPEINIEVLLTNSNISCYEIEDESHWLTQKQVDSFSENLLKLGLSQDVFRKAGQYMASAKSISVIRQFIKGFILPGQAYRMLGRFAPHITRGANLEVRLINSNCVEITSVPLPGVDEKAYQCENRKGCLEAVATVFTNKLPQLEHPECLHRGDDKCRYLITWQIPLYLKWKLIRNYSTCFSIIAFILAFLFIPFNYTITLSLLLVCLLFTSTYSFKMEIRDLYSKMNEQSDAADRFLEQLNVNYNNSLLVQEIGQAAASITEQEQLFDFVLRTLQKRLSFDRGMIMLADSERKRLVYASGFGYEPHHEDLLKTTSFQLDKPNAKGPLVRAFHEQKPFLVQDIEELKGILSDRSYQFAQALKVKSFICVPIIYKGVSEGILAVDHYHTKRSLTQSEVSLLMGVATQIGISINNIRYIEQIRRAEEQFRLLSENSPDIIYILSNEGKFLYVNPAWENILGYERNAVIGRPFSNFIKKEEVENYQKIFLRIRDNREIVTNFKGTIIAADGTERMFYMSGAPNIGEDGTMIGIVGTFRDFTKEYQLETKLRHASKMEELGRLTGGIAHDFNNIVQAISGYNQVLMLRKSESHPDWRYLVNIAQLTQRAGGIIKQLLIFSRQAESEKVPVKLNEEISRYFSVITDTFPKNIKINLDLEDNLNMVHGDVTQLGQILMNLTINARDAMPEGGVITIRTRNVAIGDVHIRQNVEIPPGKYVLLEVNDTGIGIDKEILPNIFDPFYTTKGMGKGTGIGLAVVFGVVKNHEGFIFCESEKYKGTSFFVYLPAMEETLISSGVEAKREMEKPKEFHAHKPMVLLVDDEEQLLETGREILEMWGYEVLVAGSGAEALEVIDKQKGSIAIAVLDLMMPGMSGDECLTEIKKRAPDIKVIVATGYADSGRKHDLFAKGAFAFIQKPYIFEDLNETIKRALVQG